MSELKIAFAGDRDISVGVLKFLLGQGVLPGALLVSGPERASHADELVALCPHLKQDAILAGDRFRRPEGIEILRNLQPDYIIGIHFPYIFPEEVLRIPRIGTLNLHPAYLPFNRGWHTPSWAILNDTPAGATLHFMDAAVDSGDVVHRRELNVSDADTAHTLYERLKLLELVVFQEAWPLLLSGNPPRTPQETGGSVHRREELLSDSIQRLDLESTERIGSLLRRFRALTTNRADEAAFFEKNGKRFRVQIRIEEDKEE